ncbi:MAG: F0F1 ATP synthase subunit epsilon [Nocardioidaceae bacterium]
MADEALQVELVAADRIVWSGEASYVLARTVDGEIGVLANHAPTMSLMVENAVRIDTTDGDTWVAAVDSGFLSVADNRVSILSETAEMSHDIDLEKAKQELEDAQSGDQDDPATERAVRRAEARVRAAELAS